MHMDNKEAIFDAFGTYNGLLVIANMTCKNKIFSSYL